MWLDKRSIARVTLMTQRLRALSISTAVACLIPLSLQADLDPSKLITQYVHDVWMTQNGLPQNSVLAIAQTPDGYLWLGTENGLARFDGVRFVTFDRRNTPALKSNEIDALLVDHRGDLWIGTHGGGLASMSRGVFTSFSNRAGLSNDSVLALYEDAGGELWIGTDGGGLSHLRNNQFETYTRKDGLADNAVFSLCGDRKGGIWIGTHSGLSHWANGHFTTTGKKDGLPSGYIRSVYVDRSRRSVGWNEWRWSGARGWERNYDVHDEKRLIGQPGLVDGGRFRGFVVGGHGRRRN